MVSSSSIVTPTSDERTDCYMYAASLRAGIIREEVDEARLV